MIDSDRQRDSDLLDQQIDNGNLELPFMESFFHSLKPEWVDHYRYETRAAAQTSIFTYIKVFFNRQRRHTYTERKALMEFEALAVVA